MQQRRITAQSLSSVFFVYLDLSLCAPAEAAPCSIRLSQQRPSSPDRSSTKLERDSRCRLAPQDTLSTWAPSSRTTSTRTVTSSSLRELYVSTGSNGNLYRILIFDFHSRSLRWIIVDRTRSARSQLRNGGSQGTVPRSLLDSVQHGRRTRISDSTGTRLRFRLQHCQQQHLRRLSHPFLLRHSPPVGARSSGRHVPRRWSESDRPRQPRLALRDRWTLHMSPQGPLHQSVITFAHL